MTFDDMKSPGKYVGRIQKKRLADEWIMMFIGVLGGMVIILTIQHCVPTPRPAVAEECKQCHNRVMSMAMYFERAGSKQPKEMTDAIFSTKQPRLLAAISVIESNANPSTRGGGFKKRHDGAFQVNPAYWGAVPKTAIGQAKQAQAILDELTQEKKDIKKVLARYGGDSTDKYSQRVLAELLLVP